MAIDPGTLLLALSRRMYDDIRFVAEQNPTQVVDEDTTYVFNHLLNEIRQHFVHVEHIFSLKEMQPRTLKYKDALVVSGQLYELMTVVTASGTPPSGIKSTIIESVRESVPAPVPVYTPPPPAPPPAPAPSPSQSSSSSRVPIASIGPMPTPPAVPPVPAPPPRPAITQMHPAAATAGAPPKRPVATQRLSNDSHHDAELYGPKPPKLNEDGTIPFSLLEEEEGQQH